VRNAGLVPAFFMNRRIKSILECIDPSCQGVVDVGTDHGILPVSLALLGYQGNILATDIRKGPLLHAINSAEQAGVSDRISFTLCDGLIEEFCERIDTIVIAGMGGDLICSIIDRADWVLDPRYFLILQPMTKPEVLRYYLINNGFRIEKEIHLSERGHLYSILCVSFTGRNMSYGMVDLYIGRPEDYSDHELYSLSVEKLLAGVRKKITSRNAVHSSDNKYYIDLESLLISAKERFTGKDHGCKE
jgi:tRNA (adenine22-N1)-methyltransferase